MKKMLFVFKASVSLMILFLLYQRIPFEKVNAYLAIAKMDYLALGILIVAGTHFLLAIRTKILTDAQGFQIRLKRILAINFSSFLYKLVLPGGMVTLIGVRSYKLYRTEKNLAGAFWAAVLERLAATFALGLVGTIFFLLDRPSTNIAGQWIFFVVMIAVFAPSVIVLNRRMLGLMEAFIGRFPWESLREAFKKSVEAFERFRTLPKKETLSFVALIMITHGMEVLFFWLLARALDIPLDLATLGWMRSVVILVIMFPISIGGLGLREGILLYLFGAYGVSEERTLAFAILLFLIGVLIPAIVGGLVELREVAHLGQQ